MVAELLRLKGRVLLGGFRRPVGRVLGSAFLLVAAVAGLLFASRLAARVTVFDGPFVGRVLVLAGLELSLAALLIPAMFTRRQLLEPRAFLGYGIRRTVLAALLVVVTLIGPALLLVPLVLVPVLAWQHVPGGSGFALLAAPLLLVQLLLEVRLGAAIGSSLSGRRLSLGWVRAVGTIIVLGGLVLLLALVLPRLALLAPERSLGPLAIVARDLVPLHAEQLADLLAGSPLVSLWGAPALAVAGVGSPSAAIWIGVATIAVLAAAWGISVAGALRATRPAPRDRARRVPGWFRGLPSTPTGAIAARSFVYWVRDPRYRVVFGILPALPIFSALAFWIGGVPTSIAALVPLPLMVLVLAWSTIHNDIAYDSTAVWSHLSAATRGVADRAGRVWPVLVFGTVLIAVGTPITAWLQGSSSSLDVILGITVALLLGGIGVGSGMSARHPYPAPRPGDGAFTHPQGSGAPVVGVVGGSGGGAQAASFLLTLLVAGPAIAATVFWQLGLPGQWPLIALATGVASGLVALLIGIRAGGVAFDRRGPELLAFTMQN